MGALQGRSLWAHARDLRHTDKRTTCAYKGRASYLSADGAPDVAWFYPDPLHDAVPVKGLISFWRAATVYVDGVPVPTGMPGDAAGPPMSPPM
jgi:uncharacterized protein (DUF427 family)